VDSAKRDPDLLSYPASGDASGHLKSPGLGVGEIERLYETVRCFVAVHMEGESSPVVGDQLESDPLHLVVLGYPWVIS